MERNEQKAGGKEEASMNVARENISWRKPDVEKLKQELQCEQLGKILAFGFVQYQSENFSPYKFLGREEPASFQNQ